MTEITMTGITTKTTRPTAGTTDGGRGTRTGKPNSGTTTRKMPTGSSGTSPITFSPSSGTTQKYRKTKTGQKPTKTGRKTTAATKVGTKMTKQRRLPAGRKLAGIITATGRLITCQKLTTIMRGRTRQRRHILEVCIGKQTHRKRGEILDKTLGL